MRKIIISILAAISAFAVNAKINVDIQGAPQLSNKLSFRAGVSVEIPVSDNLSLDPGLYYSMRHRQCKEDIDRVSVSGEILDSRSCELDAKANYLQLPIYFSYNIPTHESNLQKIMVGPYFAYCLGGDSEITQRHNSDVTSHVKFPTYRSVLDSRFDFGLALEYKYILKSHFVFGIFAEIGLKRSFSSIEVLRDIPDWPDETYHMNPGPKMNEAVGLSIGYRF